MVSRISGSVEEVFSKFDIDKSGSIDVIELKKVFELWKTNLSIPHPIRTHHCIMSNCLPQN
jgi:EF-hand domain